MELAVGMVVLLVLLAGIVDLGRMLFMYIAMRDAAQEGAVVGQINPRDCLNIENRIQEYLGGTGNGITVTVDGISCGSAAQIASRSCAGREIIVTVRSPFEFAMPILGGQPFNLETSITGTVLRPACP